MIQADAVSVTFRTGFRRQVIRALDSFNLEINEGDVFALLGPNGAGKSTAMYCFLGLIKSVTQGQSKILRAPGLWILREIIQK